MAIKINIFDKGLFAENTYVVKDVDTNTCVVIDPGYFGPDVENCIGNDELKYILITHSHQDHVADIKKFQAAYPKAEIVALEKKANIVPEENTTISFGNTDIKPIITPGHSTDGVCYLMGDKLFSGDTLFYMSVGATHFPGGDGNKLFDSITKKLFLLEDDTEVFPGHGKSTSIGFEKRHNPFV